MSTSNLSRGPARLDVDERREQLLKVGTDLFSDRPYDEVSIDEIAAAAGISKGLLYHYFPTKHDFYVGAVRCAADELRELIEQDPALPKSEQLRLGLRAYFEYVEHHAAGYVTLMRGGIGTDPDVCAIVDGVRDYVVQLVVAALQVEGDPAPVLRYAIRGWLALLERVSLDWLDGYQIELDGLLRLLELTLASTLTVAAQVDERAGVDLSVLADVLA